MSCDGSGRGVVVACHVAMVTNGIVEVMLYVKCGCTLAGAVCPTIFLIYIDPKLAVFHNSYSRARINTKFQVRNDLFFNMVTISI